MKKHIRDLREKDHVQGVYLVQEKTSGTDRNGKAFLSLMLSDATGQINGRQFERVDPSHESFVAGDAVFLKGFVQLYQSRKQLVLHEVRKALDGEFQMNELISELGGDPRHHLESLLGVVAELKDAHLRELLRTTLNDSQVQPLLLKMPAAKTIHHAYRGGLIEHIHSIVKVMQSLSQLYPYLNLDLLVFGAIYHDLGKIYELDLGSGIHYTAEGRLVGHMVLACEMLDKFTARQTDFPEELRMVLKHIVLAHHGKLEYGSPKLPMFPEAMVVAMIDDLDSKLNTMFHFLKNEMQNVPAAEKWSHYHPGFERYFYLDVFRHWAKDQGR